MRQEDPAELYLAAAALGEHEGLSHEEATDFAAWVVEQELAQVRKEEPLLHMLWRFNSETKAEMQMRIEAKERIRDHCGSPAASDLEPTMIMIHAPKLLQLAGEGKNPHAIGLFFGISAATARRALEVARSPRPAGRPDFITLRP